jgi:hypothetical protein
MNKSGFFSKTFLYPSLWAIIIGLFGFLGGMIWKNWTGPEKVVVINNDLNNRSLKDTTITIIQFLPDEKYYENLAKLTRKDFQKSYPSLKSRSENKINVDSLALLIAKEYQLKYDSLRLSLINSKINIPLVSGNSSTSPALKSGYSILQVKRPLFKFPSITQGYTQEKINTYARTKLDTAIFKRQDNFEVKIEFFDRSILGNLSPLFVEIVEPKSATSVLHIWGEQFELKDIKNILNISADFKSGNYQLNIGFYKLNEINTKYPKFYCDQYNIRVI